MTTATIYASRWGYHPCDYQTYRKLKLLHAVYQKAVRQAHAWRRWKRKDPHNRVLRRRIRNSLRQTIGHEPAVPRAEPPLCPLFLQKISQKRYADKKGVHYPNGYLEEEVAINELGIALDYAQARKPVSSPNDVAGLQNTVAQITSLYDQARDWLEQQDAAQRRP
jgi:hypothetical protein